jgi:hypothetical protein
LAERSMVALHVLPEAVTTGSYGGLDIAAGDDATTVCLSALDMPTSPDPS